MLSISSFEFLKNNNPNLMAVALCEITLDHLANNLISAGNTSWQEIREIEAVIVGLETAGNILSNEYHEKLTELRGIIIQEYHMNEI
jgi:hypothetical protein